MQVDPLPSDYDTDYQKYLVQFVRQIRDKLPAALVDWLPDQEQEWLDLLLGHPEQYHDPWLLPDMAEAADLLLPFLSQGGRIAFFGDKDVDGITAIAAMVRFWQEMNSVRQEQGLAEVVYTILFEEEEEADYGLTSKIVEEALAEDCQLLIALDTGTSDLEAIAFARSQGLPVIVLDHHEPREELPQAALINPKRKDSRYPFQGLSTAGLVAKFVHGLLLAAIPKIYAFAERDGSFVLRYRGRSHGVDHISDVPKGLQHISEMAGIKASGVHFVTRDGQTLQRLTTSLEQEDRVIAGLAATFETWQAVLRQIEKRPEGDGKGFLFWGNPLTASELTELFTLHDGEILPEHLGLSGAYLYAQMGLSPKIYNRLFLLMPLVALGVMADLMPLQGENRIFVRIGLFLIRRKQDPHFQILTDSLQIFAPQMRSRNLSWHLSPVLNSPGRLGSGVETLSYFLTSERSESLEYIEELLEINRKRKQWVEKGKAEALAQIGEDGGDAPLVHAVLDSLPFGLTGLVASRLADHYAKPAVVIVRGQSKAVGSVRSYVEEDVFSMVQSLTGKLLLYGGHREAAGFSLALELVEEVVGDLHSYAQDFLVIGQKKVQAYPRLSLNDINQGLIHGLDWLEPFGMGNAEPVFEVYGLTPGNFQRMGSNQEHGKFTYYLNAFQTPMHEMSKVEVIGWGKGEKMAQLAAGRQGFALRGELDLNLFRGELRINVIVQEFSVGEDFS